MKTPLFLTGDTLVIYNLRECYGYKTQNERGRSPKQLVPNLKKETKMSVLMSSWQEFEQTKVSKIEIQRNITCSNKQNNNLGQS